MRWMGVSLLGLRVGEIEGEEEVRGIIDWNIWEIHTHEAGWEGEGGM